MKKGYFTYCLSILSLFWSLTIYSPVQAKLATKRSETTSRYFLHLINQELSVAVSGKLALCSHAEKGHIILNVKGGVPPYTYRWNTLQTTKDRTDLYAGTYTVNITDAVGKSHTERIVVQPPFPLILNPLETKDASCGSGNDGSAKISVKIGRGEPYAVTWSHGLKDTWEASNLEPGMYSVTVADKYHCDITTSFEIKAASEGMSVSEVINDIDCSGQSKGGILLDVTGGQAPYSYIWSTGATSKDLKDVFAGTYEVMVKDQAGCSFQASYTVRNISALEITESVMNESCAGAENGKIEVTVQGGTAPYSYNWSNGGNMHLVENLKPGIYSVLVTDAAGCAIEKYVPVETASALEIEVLEQMNSQCAGSNTGAIRLEVKGATGNITSKWMDDASAGLNRSNLPAGSYQLLVTDESGCSIGKTFVITESEILEAWIETSLDVDCASGSITGVAWVAIQGGKPPYQISWSSGEKNVREINFSSSGNLVVNITDALECTSNSQIRVDFPSQINQAGRLDFAYRKLKISSEPEVQVDEQIIFESMISEDFIGWEWSFGDGNRSKDKDPIHVFNNAGNFEVTLTAYDLYGCASTEKNTIRVNGPLEFITIPNAFTPNGDGLNDMFVPKLRAVKSFSMEIFNTWGEKIYSTSSMETNGWDGTHHGQESPPGNYLYRINYSSREGEQFTKTGGVTLIR